MSIVAIVAVTSSCCPARERLRRLADRLVFGRRATPLHALGAFAETSAAAGTIHDLAPRLAGLVADATGAAVVVVYVRVDDELVAVAREPAARPAATWRWRRSAGAVDRYDLAALVERRGEVLGAVALTMPPGTPAAAGRAAARRAARGAGGAELRDAAPHRRADPPRRRAGRAGGRADRSRQRLVTVQDAERQRIGRDLHDGAQQQLIAIIAKAMLARSPTARDPSLADATLQELQQDTPLALGEIRDFVNGIFPQVLADRGLVVALQQRAARLPFDVAVDVDAHGRRLSLRPVGREHGLVRGERGADQRRQARRRRPGVRCGCAGTGLAIEVVDDGVGDRRRTRRGNGLTNMGDRVAAVGGTDRRRRGTGRRHRSCAAHLPAVGVRPAST